MVSIMKFFTLVLLATLPACASIEQQCAATFPGNTMAQADCAARRNQAAAMALATMAASMPTVTAPPPPARMVCNSLGRYTYCNGY